MILFSFLNLCERQRQRLCLVHMLIMATFNYYPNMVGKILLLGSKLFVRREIRTPAPRSGLRPECSALDTFFMASQF